MVTPRFSTALVTRTASIRSLDDRARHSIDDRRSPPPRCASRGRSSGRRIVFLAATSKPVKHKTATATLFVTRRAACSGGAQAPPHGRGAGGRRGWEPPNQPRPVADHVAGVSTVSAPGSISMDTIPVAERFDQRVVDMEWMGRDDFDVPCRFDRQLQPRFAPAQEIGEVAGQHLAILGACRHHGQPAVERARVWRELEVGTDSARVQHFDEQEIAGAAVAVHEEHPRARFETARVRRRNAAAPRTSCHGGVVRGDRLRSMARMHDSTRPPPMPSTNRRVPPSPADEAEVERLAAAPVCHPAASCSPARSTPSVKAMLLAVPSGRIASGTVAAGQRAGRPRRRCRRRRPPRPAPPAALPDARRRPCDRSRARARGRRATSGARSAPSDAPWPARGLKSSAIFTRIPVGSRRIQESGPPSVANGLHAHEACAFSCRTTTASTVPVSPRSRRWPRSSARCASSRPTRSGRPPVTPSRPRARCRIA